MTDETKTSAHDVKREFEEKRSQAAATLESPVREVEGGSASTQASSGERLLVRDVMTAAPVAMESDAPVVDAARAMQAEDVGSLPVVSGGVLVGMVTDRDLVLNVLARDLDASKVLVSECCTEDPVTATPDEPLDAVLQRMASAQVRRLPVVEDEHLVGIVAQADIARAAQPEATGEMVHNISLH